MFLLLPQSKYNAIEFPVLFHLERKVKKLKTLLNHWWKFENVIRKFKLNIYDKKSIVV